MNLVETFDHKCEQSDHFAPPRHYALHALSIKQEFVCKGFWLLDNGSGIVVLRRDGKYGTERKIIVPCLNSNTKHISLSLCGINLTHTSLGCHWN